LSHYANDSAVRAWPTPPRELGESCSFAKVDCSNVASDYECQRDAKTAQAMLEAARRPAHQTGAQPVARTPMSGRERRFGAAYSPHRLEFPMRAMESAQAP
jgi:hypothetical protein